VPNSESENRPAGEQQIEAIAGRDEIDDIPPAPAGEKRCAADQPARI
jgi:hypothetical protein